VKCPTEADEKLKATANFIFFSDKWV